MNLNKVKRPFLLFLLLLPIGTLIFVAFARQMAGSNGIWTDIREGQHRIDAEARRIVPDQYRLLEVDVSQLKAQLAQAPLEQLGSNQSDAAVVSLPLPNGEFGRFAVVNSPIMAPELAAKFPEIQTYAAQGIDDPTATARLDWTPHGFHALIISADGSIYIDPYAHGNVTLYMSYLKSNFTPTETPAELPPVADEEMADSLAQQLALQGNFTSGALLRTYRLAVAATGEYTIYHGGSVADGQAAIVTAVNRVNGIYDRETAVRFTLVTNNDSVIFTDPNSDPYNNFNGFAMLDQNQNTLDSIIGFSNYDVGHVFSTGGGGVAGLGVVCSGSKGRGVTGLSNPTGDPFYVDYVSHELGHQFDATHTFNGTQSSCSGGNRTSSTAYEPGSATTIMGYAGICASDNIQSNSDDYFHTINFEQIQNHVTMGSGSLCGSVTPTNNTPPMVEAGSGGFTIPANTPFTLSGNGSDVDGDTLTYNWEQFDLGPAGSPNSPSGNAPLFRSFPADTSPERTFPRLADLLNNTTTFGEILPTYSRSLLFRLTVRDNQSGGGGVAYDSVGFDVTAMAGPFLVTAPNTAVTWSFGDVETVTWDVANTDQPPVNCANVDILISIDGGFTYPLTLLAATPNDGSEQISIPNMMLNDARLMVACSDSIFFDISDSDFAITTNSVQTATAVAVTGPTTGFGLQTYTFSAQVEPITATLPIEYEWTITDYGGFTHTGLMTDTISVSWATNGIKTIEVTATNSAGAVTSETFEVELEGTIIYLPYLNEE